MEKIIYFASFLFFFTSGVSEVSATNNPHPHPHPHGCGTDPACECGQDADQRANWEHWAYLGIYENGKCTIKKCKNQYTNNPC